MTKLVDIYTWKATSLWELEKALVEYAAQPHIAEQLESNKMIITNYQQHHSK